MKSFLAISLLLVLTTTTVFAQLSDSTGLKTMLDVQSGGHTFEVETVANFNIYDFDFDKNEKKLTLYITSGLENNLGEVLLPVNFLGGDLTFYLNDQEFFPKVNQNERISFITLEFIGIGDNSVEIIGTTYLDGLIEQEQTQLPPPDLEPVKDYDYGLIYVIIAIIAVIVGIIVGVIALVKRKK